MFSLVIFSDYDFERFIPKLEPKELRDYVKDIKGDDGTWTVGYITDLTNTEINKITAWADIYCINYDVIELGPDGFLEALQEWFLLEQLYSSREEQEAYDFFLKEFNLE